MVLFPVLSALAVNFVWKRFLDANLTAQIGVQCQEGFIPPPESLQKSYFTIYTGFHAFDQAICPLVAFFDVLINSADTLPFLTYAIGTSLPLVLLPNVEARRNGQNYLLAHPVIFMLLSQVASVGFIFPVYWLVFIVTGGPRKATENPVHSYNQAHAEALVFGIIVGCAIPSVAMLIMNDFHLTAVWQFYPALVAVFQILHLQFRPPSMYSSSGFSVIQILFFGCFMISSSTHISTVWPVMTDFDALKQLLLPSITPLPHSADLSSHLLDFLKWDMFFAFTSTALAMLWFSRNQQQLCAILLWYLVAIPLLGYGAAIMGVASWAQGILA